MEMLSGAEMLVRSLRDEGVKILFGYPGGAALHIYDALFRQEEVEHILVRHEQAAAHAADGYARASGHPGVALVTSGPGATNTLTGIATAYMDSTPLVIISGQVPSPLIGTDSFQETDMIGVSRPAVKHSFLVQDAAQIPDIVKKAFYIATTGRKGPVVIDVPKDRTDPAHKFPYEYPSEVQIRSYHPDVECEPQVLQAAMEILVQAERPVIYTGGGVIQGDASEALRTLAQRLDYPVTNTLMGLGAYPGSDRQFLGMLGMHGHYEANMAMHHCDVLLAVGARFDDRITNTPSRFCPDAKIIHVDVDPASVAKIIPVDAALVGDANAVLGQMLHWLDENPQRSNEKALQQWWQRIEEWREKHGLLHRRRYELRDDVIMPQQVIETLYEVTGGDAWVTADVGQHQMFAAQYYRFDKPRRWINSGGLGTMGFGLPAAMGVLFAEPGATVACVTGEGSIQMNIQELSTCLQYRLPVKIINVNNQALGMVKQWQDMQYGGRYSHSTYQDSLPDFVRLAQAYGHEGMRVESPAELRPKMEECFAMKEQLVFMDILVDPEEHVYPMFVAPGGSMRDMWLNKTERS